MPLLPPRVQVIFILVGENHFWEQLDLLRESRITEDPSGW